MMARLTLEFRTASCALFVAMCLVILLHAPARAQDFTNVAPPMTGVAGSSTGYDFSCALLESGKVMCWGRNQFGQLGDGRGIDSAWPVEVWGIDNAIDLSVGYSHACALLDDGRVACWGLGIPYRGEIARIPVIMEEVNNAVALDSKIDSICVVVGNGSVLCLSTGGLFGVAQEIKVVPGITDAVDVANTSLAACVIRRTGEVLCFSLDPIVAADSASLQAVPVNGLDNVTALESSQYRICALANEEIYCWPWDAIGSGEGSGIDPTWIETPHTPESITVAGTGICYVASGKVHCMDNGLIAGIGISPSYLHTLAFREVHEVEDVGRVDGSLDNVCAVVNQSSSRGLRCWGDNHVWKLGDGSTTSVVAPQLVAGTENAQQVAVGEGTSCALLPSNGGEISCWGLLAAEAISNGVRAVYTPTVQINSQGAQGVYAALNSVCANFDDASVRCWGPDPDYVRLLDAEDVGDVAQLAIAREDICARLVDGTVRCWGANRNGEVGDGTTISRTVPVTVVLPEKTIDIAARERSMCALGVSGAIWCWGEDPDDIFSPPGEREKHLLPVEKLAGGEYGTVLDFDVTAYNPYNLCITLGNGGARCEGYNGMGSLGIKGDEPKYDEPQEVAELTRAHEVENGALHTCFLADGFVHCTGSYFIKYNQSQYYIHNHWSRIPLFVPLPGKAVQVDTYAYHSCAVVEVEGMRRVACWGWNENGEVGVNPGFTPVTVRLAPPMTWLPAIMWQTPPE